MVTGAGDLLPHVNTGSTTGQIILLIFALGTFISSLSGKVKSPRSYQRERNARIMAEELKTAKAEVKYTRELYRSLSEWQLTARELIRVLRSNLAKAGRAESEQVAKLVKRLEDIESKDYGIDSESSTLE